MDRIDADNASDAMFLRLDMPGHVRHTRRDTFSEIYLSYRGRIPAAEFLADFPPDARFDYRRQRDPLPERFIRGYRLRDAATGRDGPWLLGHDAGTLGRLRGLVPPAGLRVHDRGVRRPAHSRRTVLQHAFLVGYFDSLEEAPAVYDAHKGHTALEVSAAGWKLAQ